MDITPIVDGYFDSGSAPAGEPRAEALRRGNFMARARMAVLYDHSVTWRGLVVGTGNKTETLIGYTTLWGDRACAFNPIGDLYKSQVRQLAEAIGVPDAIMRKAPSADLWPGQTDEAEVGFSYAEVDRLLYWLVDRRRTPEELAEMGFEQATVDRVIRMVAGRGVQAPGAADRQARPAHGRRGLPLPAPPARLRAELTRITDVTWPWLKAYGAARCTWSPRPSATSADVTLRSLEVLRAVAVVAAEDTRLTRRLWARHGIETPLLSYHAQSPVSRRNELLERLERGEDVALVTDAGTPLVSDPGGELVTDWAERGGTVVPIPGASAVLAALVASGIPAPRWGFEGFLPRSGGERKRRLARIAADDRATVLFESPGRTAATLRDLAAACGGGAPRGRGAGADQAARGGAPRHARRTGRVRGRDASPGRGHDRGQRRGRGTRHARDRGGRSGRAGRGARQVAALVAAGPTPRARWWPAGPGAPVGCRAAGGRLASRHPAAPAVRRAGSPTPVRVLKRGPTS